MVCYRGPHFQWDSGRLCYQNCIPLTPQRHIRTLLTESRKQDTSKLGTGREKALAMPFKLHRVQQATKNEYEK